VAQSDAFGYFAMPERSAAIPGAPLTPEVFVKMQDARAQGRDFWVFWGGLTDLTYTLTIRDTVTGVTKVVHSPAPGGPAGLGIDTSGFLGVAAQRVVNVGQDGSKFVDSQSGTKSTSIRVGDTVKWSWIGGPHSSTSGECTGGGGGGYYGAQADCTSSGVWNSSSHSPPYEYSRTFTTPGTYTYYCEVHGAAMTGSVVVSADAPGTPAAREPVERVQDRSREARLVGRPSPNTGAIATPTPTVAGPSPTPTRTPTPPTAGTRVVEIRSDFFRDRVSLNSITTIDVGTKVQWEWESGFHSTTSGTCCIGDGTWDSLSKSSGTFDHTFVEADRGKSFPYFCREHGSMMTGTVVVNP
jgi:plastocyanin